MTTNQQKYYHAILHPRGFANEFEVFRFDSKEDRKEFIDDSRTGDQAHWRLATAREARAYAYDPSAFNKRLWMVEKVFDGAEDADDDYSYRKMMVDVDDW